MELAKRHFPNLLATSPENLKQTTSLIATRLSCKDVERFLEQYQDLVPAAWIARHAKFVYRFGYHHYEKNAAIARKKTNPQAYMATLISINLSKS